MSVGKGLTIVFCVSTALFALNNQAVGEVYRWVDENGVVHYTSLPPKETDAQTVNIRSAPKSGAPAAADEEPSVQADDQTAEKSYAQQARDERAMKRKEHTAQRQAIEAGCQQRREIVARLEPSTRVMVTNEDGSVSRLDDNKRLEALGEAKDYIARKCN
jgi:hypothetical protein